MEYIISDQCSKIETDDIFTLYNWENAQEVHLKKNQVKTFTDNKISFVHDFESTNIEYLLRNHFICEKYSENEIEQRLQKVIENTRGTTKITLMPSGYQCNFRCKYCYESHDKKVEYGEKEHNYFVQYVKSLKGKIVIDFFGGEPLLNYKWIKNLITAINRDDALKRVRYSMTTNGYLLNKERISFLINAGVRTFQITVDGLEETHNELRVLKNGGGSWSRIIENLKLFKNFDGMFKVILRINYNSTSLDKEKLLKLLDILSFAKEDVRFKFIFREIGDYSGINSSLEKYRDANKISLKRGNAFLTMFEYLNTILDNGFFSGDVELLTTPAGIVCYAAFPQNIAVNGEGDILRCTVAVDQNYNNFGKIDYSDDCNRMQLDDYKTLEWEKGLKRDKKCYKCKLLYQCLGMNCPVKNIANNSSICPPIALYSNNILELVVKQKKLLKTVLNRHINKES